MIIIKDFQFTFDSNIPDIRENSKTLPPAVLLRRKCRARVFRSPIHYIVVIHFSNDLMNYQGSGSPVRKRLAQLTGYRAVMPCRTVGVFVLFGLAYCHFL